MNRKAVTITTGSDSKAYDGTALTEGTATIAGLVTGESVTLTATGSQTEVGSSDNTYAIEWDNAKASNYTVTDNLGTLTVTTNAAAVTLTAPSASKTYDGTALTKATGVTASGLPAGFTIEATASGSQTDAGSSANVVDDGYVIKDADGNDKTANFTNVTTVPGTLTVNRKAVTITTGSDSKAYDGTALTNATAGIEGLVDGETVTLTATGSQTEVGSSDNTYDIEWDNASASNYTVTNNLGTLTVTTSAATVTLTAPSDSKTYDGTALTKATVVTASGLPTGFTVEATASGSQTDAGSSANVVNDGYVIKDADGNDKTANFTNVTKVPGTLTVNRKAVTITTGSDSKAYDGTALTEGTATIAGLVTGESVTLTATGSQTEVGSSDNTYDIEWDNAKASNYTVTNNLGTLTITENAAAVTLTAPSDSKTYDGTALTKATVVTASGLPDDFTIEATASGSQTDAGSSANVVNDGYVIKDANGNDKTANFTNVTKVNGTLTVNPRQVTLTSATASKVYDGTALTKDEVTVGGDGWATGEGATYNVTGTQTNVGTSKNTFTYVLKGGTLAGNYIIKEVEGDLKVTALTDKVTVTITENSGTEKYDGTEKTVEGYEVTGISNPLYTVNDFTFSGNATVSGTNVGIYNMDLKPEDFENISDNFEKVTFVIVDGALEITPVEDEVVVTITENGATYEYDGTEKTVTGYTVTGISNDLYTEDDFTFSGNATVSGTNVGIYDMELKPADFTNTSGNFTNVTFVIVDGALEITPVEDEVVVTITENGATYEYDGTEKTVTGYTVTGISNDLYTEDDFTFSGNATVSGTNVGIYDMELKPADFTNT
ncbi:MAG: beta strand repeat-containing protein, partial [Candidatus Excrementavichristensenella sp.]